MAHVAVTRNETVADVAVQWATANAWQCGATNSPGAQNCNSFTCGQAYASLYDLKPAPERLTLTKTMDLAVGGASQGYDKNWFWIDWYVGVAW